VCVCSWRVAAHTHGQKQGAVSARVRIGLGLRTLRANVTKVGPAHGNVSHPFTPGANPMHTQARVYACMCVHSLNQPRLGMLPMAPSRKRCVNRIPRRRHDHRGVAQNAWQRRNQHAHRRQHGWLQTLAILELLNLTSKKNRTETEHFCIFLVQKTWTAWLGLPTTRPFTRQGS